MPFFEGQSSGNRRKSWRDIFVQYVPGDPVTVRFIEPDVSENRIWKHYIPQARTAAGKRGMTVPCPGIEECALCARNQELKDRDHPDFCKSTSSYYSHVLDLTPIKVCPLCGTASRGNKCAYDDNDLSEEAFAEPALKILEGSRTLFEQINTVEMTIVGPYDADRPSMYGAHNDPKVQAEVARGSDVDVPYGITAYPITLSTTRTEDGKRIITPVPAGAPDEFDYRDYLDERYEKWDAWLLLQPDELIALANGAALVELLKARNKSESSDESDGLAVDDDEAPF
jgi:hypothetical protein